MSDIHAHHQPAEPALRGGFWRRVWAFVVDVLLTMVPFQIVVAVLYPMTDGAIQISSGIVISICQNRTDVATLPSGLDPPPPAGANYTSACRASFFGLETARWLTVGRETREGAITKKVWRTYALDREGRLTKAYTVDWIAYLALFLYLVALEHRLGATLGKKWLGLRVIDVRQMDRPRIPLGQAVARNLLLWIGLYPMLIVFLGALLIGSGGLEGLMNGGFFAWFMASGLLGIAIYIWIVIAIARKRDPIYDALARTAVVRR
jgi:uncharacterized RDD family membrane protein YckC